MGWQDREYSQTHSGLIGRLSGRIRVTWAITFLLLLHAVAAAMMLILHSGRDADVVRAHVQLGDGALHPLAVLLHPFAMTNPLVIALVLFFLWALGRQLGETMTNAQLLLCVGGANLAAGFVYLTVALLSPTFATRVLDYPLGALAGLLWLTWYSLGDQQITLAGHSFGGRTLYAACAGLAVLFAFMNHGAGALAWLGAALAGAGATWGILKIMVRVADRPVLTVPLPEPPKRRSRRGTRSGTSPEPAARRANQPTATQPEIDQILTKISREGMQALTPEERNCLEEARRELLRRGR